MPVSSKIGTFFPMTLATGGEFCDLDRYMPQKLKRIKLIM